MHNITCTYLVNDLRIFKSTVFHIVCCTMVCVNESQEDFVFIIVFTVENDNVMDDRHKFDNQLSVLVDH